MIDNSRIFLFWSGSIFSSANVNERISISTHQGWWRWDFSWKSTWFCEENILRHAIHIDSNYVSGKVYWKDSSKYERVLDAYLHFCIFKQFPAALNVYWFTSNLFTITSSRIIGMESVSKMLKIGEINPAAQVRRVLTLLLCTF